MSRKKLPKKIQEEVTKPLPQVSQKTLGRRRLLFIFFLIFISVAFAGLTVLAKTTPYFPFDLSITLGIQAFNPGWFDALMNFITLLGTIYGVILLLILADLYLWFRKRHKDVIFLSLSTLGAEGLGVLLKGIVARARPSPTLVHQVTKYLRNDSFPSGHVLFYVGFFGYLIFLVYSTTTRTVLRRSLMALFLLLILLVGPSRIYLGAHWFSDVLGAYMLGFLWLVLVIFIHSKYDKKTP